MLKKNLNLLLKQQPLDLEKQIHASDNDVHSDENLYPLYKYNFVVTNTIIICEK